MTTTSPTIPAWINVDAIVDPFLKQIADELSERFTALYDEMLPLCQAALTIKAQIAAQTDEQVKAASELTRAVADLDDSNGIYILLDALNGSTRLHGSMSALAELFRIAADNVDPHELDEEVSEVSAVGPCPVPMPAALVERAVAARQAFVAAQLGVDALIEEYREAVSAIEFERYRRDWQDNDELVVWINDVLKPVFDLWQAIDDGWWYNAAAEEAKRRYRDACMAGGKG